MAKQYKRYEDLNSTDDFLFCKILTNHPELCRELAELIIGRKIGGIVRLDRQVPVEITADGRGVRFDVYLEDDRDTIYEIEMQTTPELEIGRRFRYYQGMIDLNSIERGAKYRELKRSYVIFICLQNPFPEAGRHRMVFRNLCEDEPSLTLNDEAVKIVLSPEGTREDMTVEMEAFLRYLTTHLPSSAFTEQLEAEVLRARAHNEWKVEYMTLEERDERMREEGRAEGREEGRAEGREEGALQNLTGLVCRKLRRNKQAEQIADELETDPAQVRLICEAAAPYGPEYPEDAVYEALVK